MIDTEVDLKAKWEAVFRTTPWARYPSEEMIRFVVRQFAGVPDRKKIRFLDLGCGIGTASWYLSREGYKPEGIDASDTAIQFARQWIEAEGLEATFQVAMMQSLPFEDARFDCVVDNGSSTSTPLPVIRQILSGVRRVLKPNGVYFGTFLGDESTITGITNPHSDDPKFYEEITSGPIKKAATVRLMSKAELDVLFSDFSHFSLDYSLRTVDGQKERVQYWHVTAKIS